MLIMTLDVEMLLKVSAVTSLKTRIAWFYGRQILNHSKVNKCMLIKKCSVLVPFVRDITGYCIGCWTVNE